MKILGIAGCIVSALLVGPSVVSAQAVSGQAVSGQATPPESAQTTAQVAPEVAMARAMVQGATTAEAPATLSFNNRAIVEFHATVLGRTPSVRGATAERVLHDLVGRGQVGRVSVRPIEQIMVVSVGTLDLFALVPADASPLGETLQDTARRAAETLQIALDESIEIRTPWLVALSIGWSLLATVLLVLLLRLLGRARRALVAVTVRMAERQLRKLPGGEVVRASRLPEFLRGGISLVAVVVGLFLVYTWLTFVLNRFPYLATLG